MGPTSGCLPSQGLRCNYLFLNRGGGRLRCCVYGLAARHLWGKGAGCAREVDFFFVRVGNELACVCACMHAWGGLPGGGGECSAAATNSAASLQEY